MGYALQDDNLKRMPPGQRPPLSFEQERWLLREWLDGINSIHTRPFLTGAAFLLDGRLDLGALHRALNEVVRRHDVLRSTFPPAKGLMNQKSLYPLYRKVFRIKAIHKLMYKLGNMITASSHRSGMLKGPAQAIKPEMTLTIPVADLSGVPEDEKEAACLRLIAQELRRPFDYSHGPMLRLSLIELEDERHVLNIVMHHLISDGWSLQIFVHELTTLYQFFSDERSSQRDGSPLAELPIQYGDFAFWQRERLQGPALHEMVAYWKQQFAHIELFPHLELPFARSAPVSADYHRRGDGQSLTLPPELVDSLKSLCRRQGVTMFMLMLAALKTLLHHYTGREHLGVFSPFANRTLPETQNLIGWFAHVHVLSGDCSGDPRFSDFLNREREVVLGAYAHQEIPYTLLFALLLPHFKSYEVPRQVFDIPYVHFDLSTATKTTTRAAGLTLTPFQTPTISADAGLEVLAVEQPHAFRINIKYSTDRFEPADIKRMLARFRQLLESIVARPTSRLSELKPAEHD